MSNRTAILALGGSILEGHGGDAVGPTGVAGVGGDQVLKNLIDFERTFTKAAADAMASDTTANTIIWCNPYPFSVQLVSARAVGQAGLTAHDTNFATITLKTDDGAAGTPNVAVTWATTLTGGTGTWTAAIAKTGALTVANLTLVAGGCLHFNIAKAAAGVVVPISHYVCRFTRLG